MQTYIIKSGKFYKIGMTSNLIARIKDYNTHNPDFSVIKVIEGNCESFLHALFISKHHTLEWFKLSKKDLKYIDILEIENKLQFNDTNSAVNLIEKRYLTILLTLFQIGLLAAEDLETLLEYKNSISKVYVNDLLVLENQITNSLNCNVLKINNN